MRKCHQAIVQSCESQGVELLRPLVNKKSEGENLRLIEFSIFESKAVFEMIANLYVYLGLSREELRVLLDRIAEQYFMLARFSQGYNLCTEPLKIKFFVREVLEQILKVPQVVAFLKDCQPQRNYVGLREEQVLLYRAFMLLIPCAMQMTIYRNNLIVSVIGFEPELMPLAR